MKKFISSPLWKLNRGLFSPNNTKCIFNARQISDSHDIFGSVQSPIFTPKKAVLLSRITRYEYEKLRYKGISEDDLKHKVIQAVA